MKKFFLSPDNTVYSALEVINRAGERFALVVDSEQHLLGVVTDGNIRRALLSGLTVTSLVEQVMNKSPIAAPPDTPLETALALMRQHDLSHLPVIDEQGVLVELWSRKTLQLGTMMPNPVVLMVGGLGTRLGELTKDCPKPMLSIGGKPLLEIIVKNFIEQGFRNFYFAVNYRAAIIESFFGDGTRYGVSITYLREQSPLGTAGPLSLLPRTELPSIVMNGDILTRLNFRVLLKRHEALDSPAVTMVVRKHAVNIPYGVINYTEKGDLVSIMEKPSYFYPISAGINVFSPEALKSVPPDTRIDIPDIVTRLLAQGKRVGAHELDDYWLDIGRMADYETANQEFGHYFLDGGA